MTSLFYRKLTGFSTLMYTQHMPKKKSIKKDTELQEFIKSGGRNNAEADFSEILKRASKPGKSTKPKDKKSS
jgi:hypothetical protein